MAQETMKLNESMTDYMVKCGLNYNDFKSIDVELLASFVENLFRIKENKIVRSKFKRNGTFGNMKHGSIYVVPQNGSAKTVILFQKNETIAIPFDMPKSEKDLIESSFKRWCDIMKFEKERE